MRPGFFTGSSPADRARAGRVRESSGARKFKARRAALEGLEPRTLLSTLPTPTVVDRAIASSTAENVDESSPSIAVDPNNADRLVAAWTQFNTNPDPDATSALIAFSNDGGTTWGTSTSLRIFSDPTTSNPTLPFTQVLASAAFDRDGNIYVATGQTNGANSAGVVTVTKFAFGGSTPVQPTQVVYRWNGDPQPAAQNVTLIVDSTPDNVVDPQTGQVYNNPYSGDVYVAWNTLDLAPTSGGDQLAPQAIYAVGSSDGGLTFTSPRQISASGFTRDSSPVGNRMPRMAINPAPPSDPANPVRGGQVSFTWDDFATGTGGSNPFDVVRYDRTAGVINQRFEGAGGTITDATDPGGGPHDPGITTFTVPVDLSDPRFNTIEDLDVELNLNHSALNELAIRLIPPSSSGLAPITLLDNNTTAANGTTGNGITGNSARLVLDAQAFSSVVGTASPDGYYRPRNPNPGSAPNPLTAVAGKTPAELSGDWTLEITDFRATGGNPLPPRSLTGWGLRFSSGLFGGPDRQVATTSVVGTTGMGGSVDTSASPININASPVIAVDTSLGVNSPHRGRTLRRLRQPLHQRRQPERQHRHLPAGPRTTAA